MRLDQRLVTQGLARSRSQAQDLIKAGLVAARDEFGRSLPVKASMRVTAQIDVTLKEATTGYASRGATKLAHALQVFGVDPSNLLCLDAGQSTGGFTDCLLRAGAAAVVGVDVGRNQLDASLRNDDRVICIEQTNIRYANRQSIAQACESLSKHLATRIGERGADCVTVDLSFISLRLVLPALASLTANHGDLIGLVKPQFELGASALNRRGVVRSDAKLKTLATLFRQQAQLVNMKLCNWTESPIQGRSGNREFLMHLRHKR